MTTCTFKCLTDCPLLPGQDCLWDNPGIGNEGYEEDWLFEAEFPNFEWWREFNGELVRPEPKDPTRTRCPRCLSVQVDNSFSYIWCKNCSYNESLIDFPDNVGSNGE